MYRYIYIDRYRYTHTYIHVHARVVYKLRIHLLISENRFLCHKQSRTCSYTAEHGRHTMVGNFEFVTSVRCTLTLISLYAPHLMGVLIPCQFNPHNTSEQCLNGGNCNPTDGTCICKGPFQGVVCEVPTTALPDNVDSTAYDPVFFLKCTQLVVVCVAIFAIVWTCCWIAVLDAIEYAHEAVPETEVTIESIQSIPQGV
jgi:hypothetical protein